MIPQAFGRACSNDPIGSHRKFAFREVCNVLANVEPHNFQKHCRFALVQVKGDLAVVGTFTSAQIGSVNAAGKKNLDGNRPLARTTDLFVLVSASACTSMHDNAYTLHDDEPHHRYKQKHGTYLHPRCGHGFLTE